MTDGTKIRRSTKHEKKMRWLAEHESDLEAQYPGMWVAISDEGLAGAGQTIVEAEEVAAAAGCTDVMYVGVKALEYQGIPVIPSTRLAR